MISVEKLAILKVGVSITNLVYTIFISYIGFQGVKYLVTNSDFEITRDSKEFIAVVSCVKKIYKVYTLQGYNICFIYGRDLK